MSISGKTSGISHERGKTVDQLAASLWNFLLACEPHIREAETFDEVQDMILRLEERDDSFHKYEIVRHIRRSLNEAVGAFIEDEIDKQWSASSTSGKEASIESVVEKITEEVVNSNRFSGVENMLRHEISSAVTRLAADFDELFVHRHDEEPQNMKGSRNNRSHNRHSDKSKLHDTSQSKKGSSSLIFSDTDGSSFAGSGSLTQSGMGFLFLTPDKLSRLADNLREGNSFELRHEAFGQLAQLPPGELLGHESWPQLKPVLEAALNGEEDGGGVVASEEERPLPAELAELSERAVKLYARMLQLLNINCKEVFGSLISHLRSMFNESSTSVGPRGFISIPSLEEGLDMQKLGNHYVMQRFNLVAAFAREIPAFWTRFPTKFADEVIEALLSLLSTAVSNDPLKKMTPLHFMALVDPKATWFTRWTHGHYSRKRLLSRFREPAFKRVIADAALAILDYARHLRTIREELGANAINHPIFDAEDDPQYYYYSREDLEFLHFVHCLSIITRVLKFSDGRDLFPIEAEGVTLTPSNIVVAIMNLLNPTICHHGPKVFLLRSDFLPPQTEEPSSHEESYSFPLQNLSVDDFCPRQLAAEALRGFCVQKDSVCESTVCRDEAFSALLAPLRRLLSSSSSTSNPADPQPPTSSRRKNALLTTDENTLLFVADILAQLASSSVGFHRILYGAATSATSDNATAIVTSANNHETPAFVIASFTSRALMKDGQAFESMGDSVTGAFLYVCRQMYKTCEGLLVLRPFRLHVQVAAAWNLAARQAADAATPTPQDAGNHTKVSSDAAARRRRTSSVSVMSPASDAALWERNLMDHLLNYATTPNGVLLLQTTGAMNDCVAYMVSRYDQKRQVSKFEKFGYGSMVSQLATTCAGMSALASTSFIKTLVIRIWESLELDDDACAIRGPPPAYPVAALDKSLVKPFRILVNVCSSFPALFEHLNDASLPVARVYNFRDAPNSLVDLMDRIILVDSPEKMHSLFNYEQSHVFGLKFLAAMISSLDCLLFLQTRFGFQEALLRAQRENVREDGDDDGVILDMLSLERNYILVKSYVVGGPNERVLPPRTLDTYGNDSRVSDNGTLEKGSHVLTASNTTAFPWPLFSAFPVPRDYAIPRPGNVVVPTVPSNVSPSKVVAPTAVSSAPSDDLSKHLEDFRATMVGGDESGGVYDNFADAFKTFLTTKGHELQKSNVIFDFMELAVHFKSKQKSCVVFSLPEIATTTKMPLKSKDLPLLSDIQMAGVKMTVRYGCLLRVFPVGSEATASQGFSVVEGQLVLLLQQCKWLLRHHQSDSSTSLKYMSNEGGYPGHDWLASTVFILACGHADRAWKFLLSLAPLLAGGYLWLPYLSHGPQSSIGTGNLAAFPGNVREAGVHPLFFNSCHLVEMLVRIELPLVFNAIKMSGCTLASTAFRWLSQLFWNFLNWEDICQYLALCLVLGIDFQVYLCVAIIRHLEEKILSSFQDQDLVVFLTEEPLRGFYVADHLPYLFDLEKRYRSTVMPFMSNFQV